MSDFHSSISIKGFVHLTSDYKSNPITIAVSAIAAIYPEEPRGTGIRTLDSQQAYNVLEDYHEVLLRIQAATAN